jgi:hypothetical protein
MINFQWKILEITSDGKNISHAKYHVKAEKDGVIVETEGNAYADFSFGINYDEITEMNVINTIKNLYTKNDVNLIEFNLEAQLLSARNQKVDPPWHVDTFKVEV